MKTTGVAKRPDGEPDFVNGVTVYPKTTIYTGKMLVRQAAWEGADRSLGETEVRTRPWRIKLPHGSVVLKKDDEVTVTSPTNGPALDDRTFRITDYFGDDWSPTAPYFAEEVT